MATVLGTLSVELFLQKGKESSPVNKMAPNMTLFLTFYIIFILRRKKLRKSRRGIETYLNPDLLLRKDRMRRYLNRRKYAVMACINSVFNSIIGSRRVERSIWTYERSGNWWNYIVCNMFCEDQWIESFRMKKSTFDMICNSLRPYIKRRDTIFRKCIPVEKRVAVALWTLATSCEYRTVAHLFGISISSVSLILKEFCKIVTKVLAKRYIHLPRNEELRKIMTTFEERWGFPNCAGAIEGCHIPIIRPKNDHTDYFNRKGWHSMLLQAVVDSNYLFRDTCIGWPGRVHDARVLANSKIYDLGQDGSLFANQSRQIDNVNVPVVILGDPAYPLLQWLMKPYAESARLTPEQKRFNYTLSRNRMVVENAFGRLKGRWRRLQKRVDCDIKDSPNLILTCCVLHNICEKQGEEYIAQWEEHNMPTQPPSVEAFENMDNLSSASSFMFRF